jgi:succinate-semialdehyde dehydrogenase/glutarate-semialdehyde dehydrogenase
MRVWDEETFGPVVAVYSFEGDDEVVARVNASRYGLNASIWTRDTRRGRAIASRIEAGTANVNDGYAAAWGSVDAPMGGFKDSGLGRRHGAEGILKYTESQTVAVQRLVPIAAPRWIPGRLHALMLVAYLRLLRHLPGLG